MHLGCERTEDIWHNDRKVTDKKYFSLLAGKKKIITLKPRINKNDAVGVATNSDALS